MEREKDGLQREFKNSPKSASSARWFIQSRTPPVQR
jgi:hypothetical protein